jgi:hypothetical protein
MYLACARILQVSYIKIPANYGLDPLPFQPVVEQELEVKKTLPVGISPQMGLPHSFALNIMESPYKRKVPYGVPEPAPPPTPRKKVPIGQAPTWSARLSAVPPLPIEGGLFQVSQGIDRPEASPKLGTKYGQPIPKSQRLAKSCYETAPFDIKMLDPTRKKNLHRTPRRGVVRERQFDDS